MRSKVVVSVWLVTNSQMYNKIRRSAPRATAEHNVKLIARFLEQINHLFVPHVDDRVAIDLHNVVSLKNTCCKRVVWRIRTEKTNGELPMWDDHSKSPKRYTMLLKKLWKAELLCTILCLS